MAMNLIDRPYLDHNASSHRGLSTAASAALHAAVLVTLVLILGSSPVQDAVTVATTASIPEFPIWLPNDARGADRDQGGEKSIAPPQPAQAIGEDRTSLPASTPQQPSIDATTEPVEDIAAIAAQPLGDSTQLLAGAINSSGTSLGPGDTGTGTSTGKDTPGFGDGAIPGGPGVTTPVPILRVTPKYTVEAMQARVQGVAMVECVVLPDGTVGDARIIRSLDRRFGLDDEALIAAKRWRFKPGLLNGKPVAVLVTIELMFTVR